MKRFDVFAFASARAPVPWLASIFAAVVGTVLAEGQAFAACDPSREAVAHFAGGVPLDPQPENAPIPCASAFGPTTSSAPVAVVGEAAFGAPLVNLLFSQTGAGHDVLWRLARSSDRGTTWQEITAPLPGIFAWMSSDPTTGRLWYTTSYHGNAEGIASSDDGGETWQVNPFCCPKTEGAPKIMEGPPPEGGSSLLGDYPHIVYFCANTAEELGAAGWGNLTCYKSLDGGATFDFTGGFPDPVFEIGGPRIRTRPGVVGTNGVLYFPVRSPDGLAVNISEDEGATWRLEPVTTTEVNDNLFTANLGVDADGNLYFGYFGAQRLPTLTISSDGGETWSEPIQVGAPGIDRTIQQLAIAVGEPGHVAIAYMGSTDAGATFSGYITESRDVLAGSPVFWSAAVNDPAHSLELGTPPAEPTDAARGFTNRLLYRTAAIGPDGTPWAGFHCYRTGSCPNERVGVVGHLEWEP